MKTTKLIIVKLKVPLKVPLKVGSRSRSRSGHGQVRSDSNSNSNSNSKVGPELYTKIGFHHPTTHHHTISKSVSREEIA